MALGGEPAAAATLVAAILEHQGLLAQARVLDDFQGFFRDAGALVYLISGIGAVISVILYGSFRAPRYLIIGPALFWLLVGPRTGGVAAVEWKLGDGQPRAMRGEATSTASTHQKVLDKLNQAGELEADVAYGFWLFAKPINDFTNEMLGLILKDEDVSDHLVASRIFALETLAASHINDAPVVERLEKGFLLHCPKTLAAAHKAASMRVKDNAGNARDENSQRQKRYAQEEAKVVQYANDGGFEWVPTKRTGFAEYIEDQQSTSDLAEGLMSNGAPLEAITCAEAWGLLAEEIWHRSTIGVARIIEVGTSKLLNEGIDEKACEDLTRKALVERGVESEFGEDCNLQPAVALMLINNHLTKTDTFNRVYNMHWNDMSHKNPTTHAIFTPGFGFGEFQVAKTGNGFLSKVLDVGGRMAAMVNMAKVTEDAQGRTTRVSFWGPAIEIRHDFGMDDAMWNSTRLFEVARLRQQLFTYALNLPYYQGMLLYLLAITYPFFALLVIVPGKASAFLNIPMAWLWVKSWDIGFAAVILLDKVMFNLLPSAQVNQQLHNGPWFDIKMLPLILSEAYNYDVIGSIHHYYSILSFVWLAIPIITGFLTLKAKRGVLSMFSDAAANTASESGAATANAFSLAAQDKRTAMMKKMQGFALKSNTLGKQSPAEGRADLVAKTFAAIQAAAHGTGISPSEIAQGNLAHLSELSKNAGTDLIGTYSKVAKAEMDFESTVMQAYDPMLGRWSNQGIMLGAYTAAMDGGGGYELYDHKVNVSKALIDSHVAKVDAGLNALSTISNNFGAKMFDATTTAPGGMFNFSTFLAGSMMALTDTQDPNFIGALRRKMGGEGYTDKEYHTAIFNRVPGNPDSNTALTPYENTQQGFFASYFGLVDQQPAPGGMSDFIRTTIGGSGGKRTVEYLEPGENSAGFNTTANALGLLGDGVNSINAMDVRRAASEGSHSLLYHSNNAEWSIQADSRLRQQDPAFYQREVQNALQMSIALYGASNIQEYQRSQGSSNVDEITVKDVWAYSRHIHSEGGMLPDTFSTEQKNFFKEQVKLDSTYGGYLDSNPRAAMQEVLFWHKRRGASLEGSLNYLAPMEAPIVSDPKQLLKIND